MRSLIAIASLASSFVVAACGTSSNTSDAPLADAGCADGDSCGILDAGGGQPIVPDAGGPQCPAGTCNYQDQTGCAAGQACRPQFTATSTTVTPGCEAAASGESGAACTAGADCAIGYYCIENVCRKQCCGGDWSACDPGESCIRQFEVALGGKDVDSGMELCFPVNDCDPLAQNSCADDPGTECKIVDPTGAVACEPKSSAKIGDACSTASPCAAGAICVANQCRALCRAEKDGGPVCATGQGTCVHFERDPAGIGECTPE
ncbi:MAG TPA: hypothetical protein VHV51_17960 [Polyangiaceae bacterium]|jgi:hypothetical protein|nr:hypothetical protein [Polyangiaceae bacterium]